MARADDLLSHPLVLRAAWLRAQSWYQSGNLAPEPEWSLWRLHPEEQLRHLAKILQSSEWVPESWRLLPYPKKGCSLRHYVLPTVRDQVAFMAHLVLIGPFIDSQTANFAFGNRWYRPLRWDRRAPRPRWGNRPYPLLSHHIYLPYARSHGLYRRVAHWTAAKMTGAPLEQGDYSGFARRPDDYPKTGLPDWIRDDWWLASDSKVRKAYWATLDIQLAYPSIRLEHLSRSVIESVAVPPDTSVLGGYPQAIVSGLLDPSVRRALAHKLLRALSRVSVNYGPVPHDSWRPQHARASLPPDKTEGLPTGLAVSGLLLNAALAPMDRAVHQYLKSTKGDARGAVLRFADDMTLLCRSRDGLARMIEAVCRGLADSPDARLADSSSRTNLYLNLDKIGPDPVRRLVAGFLETQAWERCGECDTLTAPTRASTDGTLEAWLRTTDGRSHRANLERTAVVAGRLGPFVTSLVERLSEIGHDTLTERFGEGARQRLTTLHELARFEIDDLQVRPDTRRAFAANRLVRAWLPQGQAFRDELLHIRESIAHVVDETPWKFALWGAVVRAAARREHLRGGRDAAAADGEAGRWLDQQLIKIAHATRAKQTEEMWTASWPETGLPEPHHRSPVWRTLYVSYHRTAFWHALARVCLELWQHCAREEQRDSGDAGPRPTSWAVRAVPEGWHRRVLEFLSFTDRWVKVLYRDRTANLGEWPWELDALSAAFLAGCGQVDLAEAWLQSRTRPRVLAIPERLEQLHRNPQTARLLRRWGRTVPADKRQHRTLTLGALAQLQLAGRDIRLGNTLFPLNQASRIAAAQAQPRFVLAAADSLGCLEFVGGRLADGAVRTPQQCVRDVRSDTHSLWDYARARRALLSGKF